MLLRIGLALVLAGVHSPIALSDTRSWDGGGRTDHSWTTAENWSGDALPSVADTALFARGANFSYDVDFPNLLQFGGDINTAGLLIGSNTVTFQNSPRSNTGYNVAESMIVGYGPGSVALLNMQLPNMTAKRVVIGDTINSNTNGTLNVTNNGQLTVTGSQGGSDEFVVGYEGTGTLNISGGGKVILTDADGDIALGLFHPGTVTVTGAGSTLSTARRLSVGAGNSGSLHVSAGGSVNSAIASIGSNDDVIIEGTGSIWTNIGELFMASLGGSGLLRIHGGGTVNNGTAYVGRSSSLDTVLVDSAQSTWTNDEIYIGDDGRGAVGITGGGHLTSRVASIGVSSAGVGLVTVVGPGSVWEANQIIVGDRGHGFVDVLEGGHVNSGNLDVARGPFGTNPTGEVRIDGEGSEWVCISSAHIGYTYGEGLLEITNGGKLRSNGGSIGASAGMISATGTATVSGAGALWTLTGDLNVGLGLNGAGSLTIANSGTVNVGGLLKVGPTGEIHGDGNIVGKVQNGGLVAPGTSSGALNIDGDYAQTVNGKLRIELAPQSSYDRLFVTGAATLDGTLDLVLINGFVPTAGDSFTIMTFGSRMGTFAALTGAVINPNLQLAPVYSATDLRIITANTGEKTWGVDSGGLLSVGSNWVGGVAPTRTSESVAFSTAISADRTIDVDIPASLISARFDDDNNYTLAGAGPLRFQAAGPAVANLTVQNTNGNGGHTINTPIEVLGDLVITQNSTQPVTIGGPLDAAPGRAITKAGPGTLIANRVRAGALTVNAGALVIAPNGGNTGTLAVDNLSVNGTSRLDLNNNDLVVRATAANKDAVHDAIQDDIASAKNGLDAALITKWDGPGITSSIARTFNVAQGYDLTGLGVIRNSDLNITTGIPGSSYNSFSGQAVTPDDVLVKYTYIGDANLNGVVSFDDYVGMDNAFFGLIPNLGWATGDINFDNVINFDDYSKVDQAFFFQGAPLSGEATAVPEPGTWMGTCLASALIAIAAYWYKIGATRAIPSIPSTMQADS